jgi:thiol-disulfide isomerase/thioredoxin
MRSIRATRAGRPYTRVLGAATAALALGAWPGGAPFEGAGAVLGPLAAAQPRQARRAWLGVELARDEAGGVVARRVSRTSPADAAGVKAGDHILAIDGRPVGVPRDVVARVAEAGPGASVRLRVRRGGVESELVARLEAHPGEEEIAKRDKVGTFAPSWGPLTATSGTPPASIQAARGRVVIVDFWASWCGPCRLVAPTLSSLQDRFGAQGLTVVGISGDEPAVAARTAQSLGVRYATGVEKGSEASRAYGVRSIPTMFVVDRKGVVRDVKIGFHPAHAAELERLVAELLAEDAPPAAPRPPAR